MSFMWCANYSFFIKYNSEFSNFIKYRQLYIVYRIIKKHRKFFRQKIIDLHLLLLKKRLFITHQVYNSLKF